MENNINENLNIRTYFNENDKQWYFSIVDIINLLIETNNPSNYWKVQKNRLKSRYNELVTECNQLKMPAKDGKMYLTDVASADTIVKIINILSPEKIKELKNYLSKFQAKNQDIKPYEDSEFELLIDGYQDKDNIYIKAMIAGVKSSDLFISIGFDEITISGIRGRDLNLNTDNLFKQELKYGSFTRSIKLNEEIDIDEAKLEVKYGVLTLKLPKINKNRKRILKINY
jgi:HSP20 family molecular chaperone IbpA